MEPSRPGSTCTRSWDRCSCPWWRQSAHGDWRIPMQRTDPTSTIALASDPRMPQTARRYVASSLREAGWTQDGCGVVELLTSELVTNAMTHADGPTVLMLAIASDHVRVTVEDRSPAQWPGAKVSGE